ncbi:uncharacterized protein M6B38_302330 [Iris pallida]|uniref:Uncharacterized protein n=1 Tax=Iris pallida TaxID=29817 RepID=A0AAX6HMA5_IRIPA|nr:uncharacterized protein M6B38_302330 [Iris pallida]
MEKQQEEEEEEEHSPTLSLFDFYWFRSSILRASSLPHPPPPPPTAALPVVLDRRRSRHRRSSSEEIPPSLRSLRIQPPKLQTIISGKVSDLEPGHVGLKHRAEPQHVPRTLRVQRRKRRSSIESSKSLSDLEFEELKGFMDLGFTFSEAEADPRLMTIVPGLQRLKFGSAADVVEPTSSPSASDQEPSVSRPYLSEAWDASEEDPLRNWRIPAVREGVDLKDHLRFWAHTVASTVR